MIEPTPHLPADPDTNPVLVEVTRGPLAESRHRGAYAVVDAGGHVVAAAGDIDRPVFPRSAVKPFQALPLVETGAAGALGLGDAELALACGSHDGSTRAVETVRRWLARLGLDARDLACGGHEPGHVEAARALAGAGEAPSRLHDNCSGKHAGFLSLARHLGAPTEGYETPQHPVQQRVLGTLEQMAGLGPAPSPWAVDGCNAPTWAMPLAHLAFAFARFGEPGELPEARAAACRRLAAAMTAEPELVAGRGRPDTEIIRRTAGRVLVKGGAEGVFAGTLGDHGAGFALKCDDGAVRGARAMLLGLLARLDALAAADAEAVAAGCGLSVRTRTGRTAGEVRPVGPLA